jgi:hypothetical protein
MYYIYICSIILLYNFLIYIYCFLLVTIFSRNNKFKSNKNTNTFVSLNNSVGNRYINLEKDYEGASN